MEEFKRQIYYTSTLNTLTYLAFGNAELVKQISVKEYIQTLTSVLKISRADLSRKLNIPKNTLHGWYHETNRIPLPVLLDICYSAHQKLVFTPKFNPKDHNRQCLSTSKIQTRLQASLSQCPPPSLRALASELRIDRRLLSRKFPELARQIALRFQIYVTEKRKERLSRLALDIKRAIVAVRSDGKSPTQRNVEEYLRKPGLLREKCLKEIWSKERAIVPRFGSGGKKKF
ncbi:helix-turn-helix transcriptional regulator [Alicyclobacillus fastidiosus]|uniref:Helix-turn-helix transcriptional regulator n=1 Tax=Alicyclobacillus fastidiosus TaxID=392011 RepID=A0ABY6ZDY2_9BACL|nr:helix-turn-helix transcriptional regulator [Alicyclobacillus fastidiosus]WAH40717.1 helix-turn-helix transcriptional regulator [Alicyclobacillus fastidiosus]